MAVDFDFYRDVYRGQLSAEAFSEALPAAAAHVRWLCGGAATEAPAYKRAVCAAADVFAELGFGGAQSFTVGSFKLGGASGGASSAKEPAALATEAALRELSGSGLAFAGAR